MPASSIATAASRLSLRAEPEVALAGINTPLGDVRVTGPESDAITVTINAASGILYAGTFPGATVSGGGSGSLWISGSPSQVNAKLATLVYAAGGPGADTLSISLIDASAQTSAPMTLAVDILPLIAPPGSPPVIITGGTLTLDTRRVDGVTLDLHDARTGAGPATVVLVNSTLGQNTTLDISSADASGAAPRVAIAGAVELDGATVFDAGPALVTLAQHAVLTNAGRIAFSNSDAHLTGFGTLRNDGTITVSGSNGPVVNVAITGSGRISLAAGARIVLAAPVSASETVAFESNTGLLELASPQDMQAIIAGFVPGDRIQLGEVHIDAADYAPNGNGGTLTLYDGAQISASLHFADAHQLSDFVLSVSADSAADGGAITTLSVLAATHLEIAAATSQPEIYRFFDTATGTQLLTQYLGERDSIITTRPDLKFEGVAMRAVAPNAGDPAAEAVYRFFDTAHGTHFFTADSAEKDTLLAHRPDLVFEPGSTIFEHATQQSGDVPIYRFFDASNGTHFYTASGAERASILTTRSDMTAEGVAFYAPGQ